MTKESNLKTAQRTSFLNQCSLMTSKTTEELNKLIKRYPVLEKIEQDIYCAISTIHDAFSSGGKLLVCGNGGSASDSQHIVGELMKAFKLHREVDDRFRATAKEMFGEDKANELCNNLEGALPALSLIGENSLSTAFSNDKNSAYVFAQQVYGLGNLKDCLLAISTSGNSANVVLAAKVAHIKGMSVVGLTGAKESSLSHISDVCIQVPETKTDYIQELHLPIYHAMCAALEREFFEC